MNVKKITIICMLIFLAVGFRFLNSATSKSSAYKFHTIDEMNAFKSSMMMSPVAVGQYFLPSSSCRGCHGFDSAHVSNINEEGDDVNLVDRWESSMMAFAAKDPFWRAKVSQEILVNPTHSGDIQNKCLDCHAPMGSYTSKFHGDAYYGITDLVHDSLGLDGVSCGSCHATSPTIGFTYSGIIPYDTSPHVEYGPFVAPYVGPMQLYEGFTPMYSDHMKKSVVCSTCHTLINQTIDLSGSYTGGFFTEQATYHEYLNSSFPANDIKCQTCHMPQLPDPILLSNGTSGLPARTPFNQHVFAGANYFMLNLIKNNRDSLGIAVPSARIDSTLVATSSMLKTKSINYNLLLDSTTADTAFFTVKLENKAGHKFPSGYPSRRAVVQFVVTDADNDTIFRSGMFDGQQYVIGENPAFEPHHNIINQSNVSQIYELVMGDVASHFTSVLERAAVLLKDNRLPPTGFTTSSSVYDTVKISDDAIADIDFNKISGVEGSGSDYVHFHVATVGAVGNLKVRTKVYYQSVPPKWVQEMFSITSPEIDKFKTMYQNADQAPFLVAADSLANVVLPVGIDEVKQNGITVWPTLSMDGKVYIASDYGSLIKSVDVFNSEGKIVLQNYNLGFQPAVTINLPGTPGIYYLKISAGNTILYKKVVKS